MDTETIERLRKFVDTVKRSKAEMKSGEYSTIGVLNLVAFIGEYTMAQINGIEALLECMAEGRIEVQPHE